MNRKRRVAPDLLKLRADLTYDPTTGIFTWARGQNKSRIAGCLRHTGYVSIRGYYAHILAWYHYYGKWPPDDIDIDHIDRKRNNNAINNLRLSTRLETTRNRTKWKNKKDGLPLGVHLRAKTPLAFPYKASITINGKIVRLGKFKTVDEAERAYIEASKGAGGIFSPFKGDKI